MSKFGKIIFLLLFFALISSSYPQKIIKAKIAILHKSGENYTRLKSSDRLFAGDLMRIFVLPLNDCYAYIIHSDNEGATILYDGTKKMFRQDTLMLPSSSEYYTFDAKSPRAKITIICSLNKIPDIDKLFKDKQEVNNSFWNKVESKVFAENIKDLNDKSDKPFSIAGNVSAINEDFLEQQITFTGNNMLIRKYDIEIKK